MNEKNKNAATAYLDRFMEQVVDHQMAETSTTGLESKEQTRARLKLEIKSQFENSVQRIVRGISLIELYFDLVPSEQKHHLWSQWQACLDRLESVDIEAEALNWDHLLQESPLKNHLKAIGSTLYEQNQFAEAKDLFFFLTLLVPSDLYNLLACGHSAYQLQDYALASQCYQGVILVEPGNAEAWIYYTQAQIDLGERERAKQLVDILLSVYDEIEEPSLREKVQDLKAYIKNK